MKRISKVAGLLALLTCAEAASAQFRNLARDHVRLQAAQRECRERFDEALLRPRNGCIGQCREAQQRIRDRCLARAQDRYDRAVRDAMRARY